MEFKIPQDTDNKQNKALTITGKVCLLIFLYVVSILISMPSALIGAFTTVSNEVSVRLFGIFALSGFLSSQILGLTGLIYIIKNANHKKIKTIYWLLILYPTFVGIIIYLRMTITQ